MPNRSVCQNRAAAQGSGVGRDGGQLWSGKEQSGAAGQRLFEQWRATNAQYATLLFRGAEQLPSETLPRLLGQVKGKAAALEGELSQRSAEFHRQVETVTVEQVQRAIPKGAVLVEWFRYKPFNPEAKDQQPRWSQPQYIAYVLKRHGAPVVVEVGDAKTIETTVSDLLVALHDPHSSLVDELARELHKRLIQPLHPHLGDAGRIVLSPNGQLNLLPFGVLIDEKGRYLMQSAGSPISPAAVTCCVWPAPPGAGRMLSSSPTPTSAPSTRQRSTMPMIRRTAARRKCAEGCCRLHGPARHGGGSQGSQEPAQAHGRTSVHPGQGQRGGAQATQRPAHPASGYPRLFPGRPGGGSHI